MPGDQGLAFLCEADLQIDERFNVGSSYVMIVCNFQKLESEFRSEEGQHLFLFLTAILDLATKCSISKQLNNTLFVEKAVKKHLYLL